MTDPTADAPLEEKSAISQLVADENAAAAKSPLEFQKFTEKTQEEAVTERKEMQSAQTDSFGSPSFGAPGDGISEPSMGGEASPDLGGMPDMDGDIPAASGSDPSVPDGSVPQEVTPAAPEAPAEEEPQPEPELAPPEPEPGEPAPLEPIEGQVEEEEEEEEDGELKDTNESLLEIAGTVALMAATSVFTIASGLLFLGIQYTPTIVGSAFRGVLWVFSQIGNLFAALGKTIVGYVQRNTNAMDKLAARSSDARRKLATFAADGIPTPRGQYKNEQLISALKINRDVVLTNNVEIMTKELERLTDSVQGLYDKVRETTVSLTEYSKNGPTQMDKYLQIDPQSYGFVKMPLAEIPRGDAAVTHYRSKATLPGDAMFWLRMPSIRNTSTEEMIPGYKASSLSVVGVTTPVKSVDSIEYLEIYEMMQLLIAVDDLIARCRVTNQTLTNIEKLQSGLAYSVKKMFQRIAGVDGAPKDPSTYVEPTYLCSILLTNVLPPGLMELNTHASRVAAAALQVVEEHLAEMA